MGTNITKKLQADIPEQPDEKYKQPYILEYAQFSADSPKIPITRQTREDFLKEQYEAWKRGGFDPADYEIPVKPPVEKPYIVPEVSMPKITVGKYTDSPMEINETPEIIKLKKEYPRLYKVLVNDGVAAFEKAIAAERFVSQQERKRAGKLTAEAIESAKRGAAVQAKTLAQLKKTHIEVAGGEWIEKDTYNNLTRTEKQIVNSRGIDALNDYRDKEARKTPVERLPYKAQELYKKSSPEDKFSILKSNKVVPNNAKYIGSVNGEPKFVLGKGVEEFVMSKDFTYILAAPIPIVGTVLAWKSMGTAQKAISIISDVLLFATILRVASGAARASQAVSRIGTLKAAASAAGAELAQQTVAPVKMVMHPIKTIKGTARESWDMIENLIHYKKLPEAVITNTDGTFRIPVSRLKTEAEAMKTRDLIMREAAKHGGDIVLEANGQKITFSRSALIKELKGGLSHATPQGEAFIEGIKVTGKPGMPASEQGIFVAPEAAKKFSLSSAFGKTGDKPAIFVMSPEEAQNAIKTGKIYRGTAELESKFAVGYEIAEPRQILFTRIGPERTRVVIMLQKPLTARQIAKLKSLAVFEDLKAMFKPGLLIEGKQTVKGARAFTNTLDEAEFARLERVLRQTGNSRVAGSIRAVNNGLSNVRRLTARDTGIRGTRIGTVEIERAGIRGKTPSRETLTITAEPIGRTAIKPSSRVSGTPRTIIVRDTAGRTDTTGRPESVRPDRTGRLDTTGKSDTPDKSEFQSSKGDMATEWTKEEIESAIAWKDGFVVHALKSPYRRGIDEKTFHIDNVPTGLKVLNIKGKGSQEASVRVTGKLTKPVTVDVGNQDVIITPLIGGRVRLRHVRDTTGTRSQMTIKRNNMKTISRKRGRVHHTSIGGSTVLSRRPLKGY